VVVGNPAAVIKAVADLECYIGVYERPYAWDPYNTDENVIAPPLNFES
jgi:hypothetical protein